MEKGRVDVTARSRMKVFAPFTYMTDCCDPVGKYIHVHVKHGVSILKRDQP